MNTTEVKDPSLAIKAPQTEAKIHPLIRKRWSPRAFSDQPIKEEQLQQLFEAARWAASSSNEQPWLYAYALQGTPAFEKLWNCLNPGNQPWTKNAAALVVTMVRTTFEKNGKNNPWAEHDLGMANAQLILQAADQDIYGHFMAGFNSDQASQVLQLEDTERPICMIALGYLGASENLEEPYKTRELTPRKRKSVQEFTRAL
jgi:nitroreductase